MHAAVLNQAITELEIATSGEGMIDFSARIEQWLSHIGAGDGMLTVFIRHTSASLTIQENADPDVQADLVDALGKLAPSDRRYRHGMEGPDDMPAHIKSAITSTSIAVPVRHGRMMLGTWQGLYVIEHRARPHKRNVALHYLGSFPAG
ncbi:MAG: secondary thiamine-phosphate synthase enzyme YjbQ [Hyphomicrobiales bacterium]